jgi:protein-tyrosine-phosphatase
MNILFLCTGNVSRSYLAEMLLKHEIDQDNTKGIFVSSAGILDNEGMPADPVMVNYLTELKMPAYDHSSITITGKEVEWADRIYVMENRHREHIHEFWPEADYKVERLGRYIAPDQVEDDIIDPYGKAPYYYRVAQEQIAAAVKNLFKKLVQE